MSSIRSRRLERELKMVSQVTDIVQSVSLSDGDDFGKWQVVLNPENMPEYLGAMALHFVFPADYPFSPPSIHIPTIFHPNVYPTGKLCISTLDEGNTLPGSSDTALINWRPSLSVVNILIGVKNLLEEPNPNSPADVDASIMFIKDKDKYEEKNMKLKTTRQGRLEKYKILKEQEENLVIALAIDQEQLKLKKEKAKKTEVIAGSKDELENNLEDNLDDESSPSVVQPIQTRSGRKLFRFRGTDPSVGDLRQALKRKRPEVEDIELRVICDNKVQKLEDFQSLKKFENDVILVDDIVDDI